MSILSNKSPKLSLLGKRSFQAALLLACLPLTTTGCKSTQTGRCGLPDLCEPTVVRDPFPYDVGVPCKGVDAETAGYYRPRWRVLNSPEAECCAPGLCAPQTRVGGITQKTTASQPQLTSQIVPNLPQAATQQQTPIESTHRINAVPVSMTSSSAPLPNFTATTSMPTQLLANPFSTEIDPILLPAPLPAETTTQIDSTPIALPPSSPITSTELAPVLTR